MTVITPTPGRVVWYHPRGSFPGAYYGATGVPLAAIVAHVWSDRMVNLTVFDSTGTPHGVTSVPLVQEGDEIPSHNYCEWMPYQKGQAAKTEALERQIAAK